MNAPYDVAGASHYAIAGTAVAMSAAGVAVAWLRPAAGASTVVASVLICGVAAMTVAVMARMWPILAPDGRPLTRRGWILFYIGWSLTVGLGTVLAASGTLPDYMGSPAGRADSITALAAAGLVAVPLVAFAPRMPSNHVTVAAVTVGAIVTVAAFAATARPEIVLGVIAVASATVALTAWAIGGSRLPTGEAPISNVDGIKLGILPWLIGSFAIILLLLDWGIRSPV